MTSSTDIPQSSISNLQSKIPIAVVGAGGRMGRTILRCLYDGAVPELTLAGAVDLWDHEHLNKEIMPGVPLQSDLQKVVDQADVVIDFSSHFGTAGNAERLAEWKKAWVIGTTGLSKEEQAAVEAAAQVIPVVQAPNMSLGVNLLFTLLEDAARALKDKGYDVEIVERHHRLKKDAPSGTALGLGKAVARGLDWNLDEVSVHGREGIAKDIRPDKQIGFHAIRGGDFVGDHTVIFAATGESLELSHRATSRDTFAVGALRAAAWVAGKEPGLYSMKDVLGL
ncbi:MAG: 4-hydroxy-tetrahydrodipicolinate reductase [Verrucomicrobia bacterium]|nr:4-hydroxy-tetrahydrodipicolinate reductase [Kiritimatiellia bacterium]MCP5488616.1 4-hydroxy-tetrahydrodipicolinate reductase [Verrucomicrobiota bacterium]